MAIQPDEGIVQRFQAKYPGPKMHLRSVEMQFNYQTAFAVQSPDAYETLLWDVMKNDATLFMRADQVEAAWRLLMPVLEVWAEAPPSDFPKLRGWHLGTGRRSRFVSSRTQLASADRTHEPKKGRKLQGHNEITGKD